MNLVFTALNASADEERVDDLVLFKKTDTNLLIQIKSDRFFKHLIDIFGVDISRHFFNGFIEKFLYIRQTVLVHLIDKAHINDSKVQNTAAYSNLPVHISRLFNLTLQFFGNVQVLLSILALSFCDLKRFDQKLIVQNGL